MVEGGGITLGSLFDEGLVDKVKVFVAPVIIGGKLAASPIEGHGPEFMSQAWRVGKDGNSADRPGLVDNGLSGQGCRRVAL